MKKTMFLSLVCLTVFTSGFISDSVFAEHHRVDHPQNSESEGRTTSQNSTGLMPPVTTETQSSISYHDTYIKGIVEGFYGKPWSQAERINMFTFMAHNHFSTYVYAPKDDRY